MKGRWRRKYSPSSIKLPGRGLPLNMAAVFPNEGQRKKIKQKKETKRERLFKKGFSSGGKRRQRNWQCYIDIHYAQINPLLVGGFEMSHCASRFILAAHLYNPSHVTWLRLFDHFK